MVHADEARFPYFFVGISKSKHVTNIVMIANHSQKFQSF